MQELGIELFNFIAEIHVCGFPEYSVCNIQYMPRICPYPGGPSNQEVGLSGLTTTFPARTQDSCCQIPEFIMAL